MGQQVGTYNSGKRSPLSRRPNQNHPTLNGTQTEAFTYGLCDMKKEEYIAVGASVSLRKIQKEDLARLTKFPATVSIKESHEDLDRLTELHENTALWSDHAGAVAITDNQTEKMIGTSQFYRSAPCIHGFELGYIIHNKSDREKGYASEATRLFSDYLFERMKGINRHQLLIEVWNTPSWKVAERCGFLREGVLRSGGLGEGDPADCLVYSRTRKDYTEEMEYRKSPYS